MLLAMAKVMIDANTIDEPFLVEFTNAPQLVDAAGIILKDKDGKTPLVWDTVTSSAKPYVEGVKPALKGSYTVDGKPMRTAFQVLADSLKDITPQYAEEVAGIPAATVARLAQTFAKEARIGETIEIDGQKLRYRPSVLYTFRGLSAKEYGVQGWRTGLILNMLVGNIDAVGGLMLGGAYARPQYFDVSVCEYPPKRADLAQSVFYPVLEPPHRADAVPRPCRTRRRGACRTRRKCRSSTAPTARCRSRTRGSSSTDWRRPSTS